MMIFGASYDTFFFDVEIFNIAIFCSKWYYRSIFCHSFSNSCDIFIIFEQE